MDDAPRHLAVIVHSLDQALAAAEIAGEYGAGLTLESARAASGTSGIGWFIALVERVRERNPALIVDTIFDCGDEAGMVLAAFRRGLRRVRCSAPVPVIAKLTDIAAQYGGVIDLDKSTAFDLLTVPDPKRACRELLQNRGMT